MEHWEVLKDLREASQHQSGGNLDDDTDSDCSFKSEDIVVSSYPVRPRTVPKIVHRDTSAFSSKQFHDLGEEGADVEESLLFLKHIAISNPGLVAKESQREKLENICQVLS